MNTTDVLAIAAIVVSALSAAFSFWQGLIARKANHHAADSAEAAKESAEAAASQDRRDAERDHRERTGWIIRKTKTDGVYELENASRGTVYFMPNDHDDAPRLLEGKDRLITVSRLDQSPGRVLLDWSDDQKFLQRMMHLPE